MNHEKGTREGQLLAGLRQQGFSAGEEVDELRQLMGHGCGRQQVGRSADEAPTPALPNLPEHGLNGRRHVATSSAGEDGAPTWARKISSSDRAFCSTISAPTMDAARVSVSSRPLATAVQ